VTTPSTVGPLTARLYGRLPEFYRDADLEQAVPYPLLRFLTGLGAQADAVEVLFDRIDYTGAPGDTSDLVEPAIADPAWLAWLAQHVGAKLPLGASVADQRTAISGGVNGFQAGSRQALAAVAGRALTGTKYVNITPNLNGDPWTIGLATALDETPSQQAVIDAIVNAGAKPSGYNLVVTFYAASWDMLESRYPTSAAWDAVASSDALEQTR
jgi:hypothetical protein